MKKPEKYKGKQVLVLGLGKSGVAAAKLLQKLGSHVTVNDGASIQAPELLSLGISVVTGQHPLELLSGVDLLVKNPGIPYDNIMVAAAIKAGIPIITEVELAFQVSENPLIAITGTNGKTTTTTMIADILQASGREAAISGNIGFPTSEIIQKITPQTYVVEELSSFQLMGIEELKPNIAVITNIFSAHLDYHGSQEAYEEAKWRIQENQTAEDFLVYNDDQQLLRKLASQTQAKSVPFACERVVEGAYSLAGKIYFRGEEILEVVQLALPGQHNLENALSAIATAKLCGVDNASILGVLSNFSGVKHRLQFLGELKGRKVYNDSKATNSLATKRALSGFDKKTLWLLAGGLDREKGNPNSLSNLTEDIKGIKGMIVFGETALKLKKMAEELGIFVFESQDVAEALRMAYKKSNAKDVILLSPASASWDQYKTFEERGDLFIQTFEAIRKEEA